MGGVNEFISAERDSMRFFIDMLSNNWTTGEPFFCGSDFPFTFTHFSYVCRGFLLSTATERVGDLESQIETQVALIETLENMNLMYSVSFVCDSGPLFLG